MDKHRKARIPKLRFPENRGIGWHVSYRDPGTGRPEGTASASASEPVRKRPLQPITAGSEST